ncbi:MAG: hypothetical protein GC184_01290 [Rhizobiales bacterium]|nr:hypothetical protein [Hyphomicrobiales bacterium]
MAGEQGRPVWSLELQGQYMIDASGDAESFVQSPLSQITDRQIAPRNGYQGSAKATYQPPLSPFSYAMAMRIGRGHQAAKTFSDTHPTTFSTFNQNVDATERSTHFVVDFEVGKDIGIGLFGSGTTTLGGGLRYAHFDSETRGTFATSEKYTNAGSFNLSRYSDLAGPRFFARSTSPFNGMMGREGFSLGLSAGVGVLFGEQSAENDVTVTSGSIVSHRPFSRSKHVAVPVLDGSAQLNWDMPHAPLKLMAGYRYDAAYGAVDAGYLDADRQNSVQHGPFLGIVWSFN